MRGGVTPVALIGTRQENALLHNARYSRARLRRPGVLSAVSRRAWAGAGLGCSATHTEAAPPVRYLGHTARMQQLGNAITVLGILVTLVAYFGRHSGVSLADLEPSLMARWSRAQGWVRRKLGRGKTITINVNSAMEVSSAMSARVSVWSPIQPGDDIAVRADKLERNLDRLRDELHESRAEHDPRVRELEHRLTIRINELDQSVAKDTRRIVRSRRQR